MKLTMKYPPMKFVAILALACCASHLGVAQNAPTVSPQGTTSPEVAEHIQHVEDGLIGGVVIKGDPHATHKLADRMKELNVPV